MTQVLTPTQVRGYAALGYSTAVLFVGSAYMRELGQLAMEIAPTGVYAFVAFALLALVCMGALAIYMPGTMSVVAIVLAAVALLVETPFTRFGLYATYPVLFAVLLHGLVRVVAKQLQSG